MAQHFMDKDSILTSHILSQFELQRVARTVRITSMLGTRIHLTEELGSAGTFFKDHGCSCNSGLQDRKRVARGITPACRRHSAGHVTDHVSIFSSSKFTRTNGGLLGKSLVKTPSTPLWRRLRAIPGTGRCHQRAEPNFGKYCERRIRCT